MTSNRPDTPRTPPDATVTSPGVAGDTRVLPPDATPPAVPSGPRAGRGFAPGTIVAGRFRIVALLGRGGMGEVYRADDLTLDQTVAVKFLAPEAAGNPAWLARFHHEVRIARQVSHPNVCRVYDIGMSGNEHFISMEYVEGENLATLIKRIGRLSRDKMLDIARQMCAGLAAAHAKGVLHRDLKPANIMLDGDGRVRITDFGLAAMRDDLAHDDVRAGTPAYMAPEQLAGLEVSVQSDLYSLGLTLFELFTGKPPFQGTTLADYMRLHQDVPPSPPSTVIPELDPQIEGVILQCLEKDPRKRPASALAVAAALPGGDVLSLALEAGETPSPEMVAAAGAVTGPRLPWAVAALVAFAVLVFGVILSSQERCLGSVADLARDPAVFADRARQLVNTLGLAPASLDEAYGLHDEAICPFLLLPDADGWRHPRYGLLRPGREVLFWYRQGSDLRPRGATNLVFGGGRLRRDDPPQAQPGMITVLLDGAGRLRGLEAMPPVYDPTLTPRPVDWTPLLAAAGFTPDTLEPAEPRFAARVYADTRAAWTATLPDASQRDVVIEAAAYAGRPVMFAVVEPMPSAEAQVQAESVARRRATVTWISSILAVAMAAAAIPLARRSIRRGHADLRGGFRLSAFVFLARLAVWALSARHVADLRIESELLGLAIAGALAEAALVCLFYVGLEPYVRRFWPQTLVSWSRMIAGRWRDPLVGHHLLLGATLGALWALLIRIDPFVTQLLGLQPREAWRGNEDALRLLGARDAVVLSLDAARTAVYEGLFFLLLITLLRIILRRPLLACAAAVLVGGATFVPHGSHPLVSWMLLGLGVVGLGLWTLTRWGLVPVVAAIFVAFMLLSFPLTLRQQAWYWDLSAYALLIATAVAVFGFAAARRAPLAPTDSALLRTSHV